MKKITALAIAAFAAFGIASFDSAPASARGFHGGGFRHGGFHGGGFRHGGFHRHHVGFRHGHWGWRHRHYGWRYGVGLGVPVAAYAAECYYVRRYGGLIKVCE